MYNLDAVIFGCVFLAVLLLAWALRNHFQRSSSVCLESNEFERIAVGSARDGIVIQDLNGIVLWVNEAYCDIMGRDPEEMIGLNPLTYAIPPDERPSQEEIDAFRYDPDNETFKKFQVSELHLARNQRKNGQRFWMQMSVSKHVNLGDHDVVVLVCRDATDQVENELALKRATKALEKVALQDPLTGIPNRRGLFEFADELSNDESLRGSQVGLLHIDLDRFKEINDSYGHAAGDAILHHVAQRTRNALRSTDVIARIGGDEFVAICTGLADEHQLNLVAKSVMQSVQEPLEWQERTLSIGMSIGAVLAPAEQVDINDLLKRSDHALYAAKFSGRGKIRVFNREFNRAFEQKSARMAELSQAVDEGQITHRFLPILRVDTGEIRGFETLSRWNHPEEGILNASEFIHHAEAIGCIDQVDLLAAEAAARLLNQIDIRGYKRVRATINVSGAFLNRPDVLETMIQLAAQHGISNDRLVIEVPERFLVAEAQLKRQIENLHALKRAGFYIMADHFSARSLGLTQLSELPIRGLKVSRSLTSNLESDPVQRRVLSTIMDIAAELDFTTVIQGVETAERARIVARQPDQRVQGHWIAKAMPSGDILDWMEKHYSKFLRPSDVAPGQEPRYLRTNS